MVQTIQRRVTSRNATHDNGNINNFWKDSRWFCREYRKTFCYFLRPEIRKWLFGNYVCALESKYLTVGFIKEVALSA